MEQLTFLKCRDSEADGAQHKRGRYSAPATMHGVSVSDHGEKGRWSNVDYWEMRKKKLEEQTVDSDLYGAVASRLAGTGSSSSSASASQIFASCHLYFDGRVDGGGGEGLSAFGLGKLARLHGAHVGPVLTKRGVTHVICTQLSGSKEKQALRSAASSNNKCQYFVLPSWITESIAANRRLAESRFSLLAKIAVEARIARPLSFALDIAVADPAHLCRVAHTEDSMMAKRRGATFVESSAGVRPGIAARADRSRSRPCGSRPGRLRIHCARASASLPSADLPTSLPASTSTNRAPALTRRDVDGSPMQQLVPTQLSVQQIDDSPDSSRPKVTAAADPDGTPASAAPTQLDLDSSEDDADDDNRGKGHEVWLADALGIGSASTPSKIMDGGRKRFRRSLASGA